MSDSSGQIIMTSSTNDLTIDDVRALFQLSEWISCYPKSPNSKWAGGRDQASGQDPRGRRSGGSAPVVW